MHATIGICIFYYVFVFSGQYLNCRLVLFSICYVQHYLYLEISVSDVSQYYFVTPLCTMYWHYFL